MPAKKIVKYGDPRLRKECKTVTDFSVLPDIINEMYDSMYEAEGIGLAANQIGIDFNLFIIDITHTEEALEAAEFVNGKIIDSRGESIFSEGCLSIPGVEFEIKRPEFINLQYQKVDGSKHEQEFGGLYARAIQHEMDHLNGKLIVDHVSSVAKLRYKSQLKEIMENADFQYSDLVKHSSATQL
ncbi:MAG: peptide deformylase [Candidatus Neomarinimicrobiota bacterium]